MTSNTFRMNVGNRFKFDTDVISEIEGLNSSRNRGKRFFCEKRNNSQKKSRGKNSLCDIAEFENIEREFMRRMEARKMVLFEFTEKAANIYSTKFGKLLCRQETELNELKRNFVENIKSEFEDWKKNLNEIRQEEEKLMKFLRYLKKLYNSPQFQIRRLKKLSDVHAAFFQKYEELIIRHDLEVKSLKEVINEEVTEVKRKLSQEFWKKELELNIN